MKLRNWICILLKEVFKPLVVGPCKVNQIQKEENMKLFTLFVIESLHEDGHLVVEPSVQKFEHLSQEDLNCYINAIPNDSDYQIKFRYHDTCYFWVSVACSDGTMHRYELNYMEEKN